ncbi:MAG: hypothetical protein M3N98_13650 [Actinomycetota bacterium]|nr:hypothetical protein [Actinomycetota bacterium]
MVEPNGPGASAVWHGCAGAWTAWNHVRTSTSLAAAVLFTLAFGVR